VALPWRKQSGRYVLCLITRYAWFM
jgi:hypothetical protein